MPILSHANGRAATVASERALWPGHPAADGCAQRRPSQADLLIAKLRECRSARVALTLPQILRLGIGQHSARFHELREKGYVIRNEMQRAPDGTIHSEYQLVHDPENDAAEV